MASTWTTDNSRRQIFTARLRVLETALPSKPDGEMGNTVKTDILLEDPSSEGDLFAAAPYTSETVVEQALDSSRFFAVRVQGDDGRKAVLGLGFEERSEAFDFDVSLQEVRKIHGMDQASTGAELPGGSKGRVRDPALVEAKRDFSLKPGETITVSLAGRGARSRRSSEDFLQSDEFDASSSFMLLPSSSSSSLEGGQLPLLSPPPSAHDIKSERRRSQKSLPAEPNAALLGFDDGEFGEFQ